MSRKKWGLACGLGTVAIGVNLAGQYLILSHFESRRPPVNASVANAPDAPLWLGNTVSPVPTPDLPGPDATALKGVFTDEDGFPSDREHFPLMTIDSPRKEAEEPVSDPRVKTIEAPRSRKFAARDKAFPRDKTSTPLNSEATLLPPRPPLDDNHPFHSVNPLPREIDSPAGNRPRGNPFAARDEQDEEGTIVAPRPREALSLPGPLGRVDASASPRKPTSAEIEPDAAVIREIVRQELPQATDAERRVWEDQLQGFPAAAARDLLQLRKQIDASGLGEPPQATGAILEVDPTRDSAPKFPRPEPARRTTPIPARPIK